uniref:Porin n=1 Tax=Rhodopseudomonas palustris (strain BisA53) TaxID=316055 RepID=Q07NY1_RHOP5
MLRPFLLCIALIIAALAWPAAAEPLQPQKPAQTAAKPPLRPSPAHPCAAFGPGFVPMEGSDTCVKLGGGIAIGAGVSGR